MDDHEIITGFSVMLMLIVFAYGLGWSGGKQYKDEMWKNALLESKVLIHTNTSVTVEIEVQE